MKSSWDAEKSRVTKDLKVAHDVALTAAVKDTKKKQWVGWARLDIDWYCIPDQKILRMHIYIHAFI